VPLPLVPVLGAAVAAGVLVVDWLEAVEDVEAELVAVLFSAVVEGVDDAFPA